MRTVKWCLSFGVVLAGVVVGYCRPCHEADVGPLSPMATSFDDGCCEDGCNPHQAFGVDPRHLGEACPAPEYDCDGGREFLVVPPTCEELKAMQSADAEKAAKLVR